MTSLREWTKSTRRALEVSLPLDVALPALGPASSEPTIELRGVHIAPFGRVLCEAIDLSVGRERVLIAGPNGTGKSTLLAVMTGDIQPTAGRARRQHRRIGVVTQGAANWVRPESLITLLAVATGEQSPDVIASLIIAHRFPLALAERPLSSLSPGERLRAALIAILARTPAVDVLVLDEPTQSLDVVGTKAIRSLLAAWRGGLVVATHDREFAAAIGLDQLIELGQPVRSAGHPTAV